MDMISLGVGYLGLWLIVWWMFVRIDEAGFCFVFYFLLVELIFYFNKGNNILKSNCGFLYVLLGKWMGFRCYINLVKISLRIWSF